MYELFEIIKLHMKLNQMNRECLYFTKYISMYASQKLRRMIIDLLISVNQVIFIFPGAP